jgi:glycosyltransferase involved in cell wall biosynthesis
MVLDHRSFIEQYGAPVADPDAARPEIRFCARGEGAARRVAARVRHRGRRRLAYVDTHFPWRRSGFRYDEALALLDLRPDTLFFSLWEMTDHFPASVLPLADFPRQATAAGVTDVYAVFLDCAAGLLGEPLGGADRGEPPPWVPPSIASVLEQNSMRLHVCMYPGGGLTRSPARLDQAARVAARSASVFSWVAECRDLDNLVHVPPALANPRFYAPVERDWSAEPLRVGFAGDGSPRKGADTAIAAFELLGDGFELHMVGPHEHRSAALRRPDRVTFHGWLNPERLRDVYGLCHVFVNPGRGEPDALGGQMIDGFPTLTAVSAMATGCLLVTTNPRSEPSFFTPDRTHIELQDASPATLAAALVRVRDDRHAATLIAAEGQRVVREKLDVFQWTRPRLERIGLLDPRGASGGSTSPLGAASPRQPGVRGVHDRDG